MRPQHPHFDLQAPGRKGVEADPERTHKWKGHCFFRCNVFITLLKCRTWLQLYLKRALKVILLGTLGPKQKPNHISAAVAGIHVAERLAKRHQTLGAPLRSWGPGTQETSNKGRDPKRKPGKAARSEVLEYGQP